MRCCAEANRILLRSLCSAVVATLLLAASAVPQPVTDLATRVAQAIAERWGIDVERIVVEPTGDATWPADAASFTLLGSGADGTFVVAFEETRARLIVRAGVATVHAVAARDLERGEVIGASDMRLQSSTVWGPPRDAAAVSAGWETKRRVSAGEPLRPPAVAPPLAVRTGQDVRIVFARPGVTITLSGRSAGQGSVGDRIAVRAETGKRLTGVIVAEGVVRVDGSTKE